MAVRFPFRHLNITAELNIMRRFNVGQADATGGIIHMYVLHKS